VIDADSVKERAGLRMAEIQLIKGNRSEAAQRYGAIDRNRLDARERALADIGSTLAAGDRTRAEALAEKFLADYPDDRELPLMISSAKEQARSAVQRPSGRPRPFPRRRH
jgi:hypothetical protein